MIGLAVVSLYACSSDQTSAPGGSSAGSSAQAGTGAGIAGSGVAGSLAAAGTGAGIAGASVGGAPGVGGAPAAGGSSGGNAPVAGSAGSVAAAGSAGSGTPSTSAFKVDSVATWRGNATAAYSIIHDDVCDSSAKGVISVGGPQLKKHGLHAGLGLIVSQCNKDGDNQWPAIKQLIAEGNDIFSHSYTHPCIYGSLATDACGADSGALYSSDVATEIGKAGDELKAQTGVSLDFFIFPYDYCDAKSITYLKSKGYLGARCGITDAIPTNTATFADPFAVNYEIFGPSYSYYWNSGSCKGKITQYETTPYNLGDGAPVAPAACNLFIMQQYVDDTITSKGWGIREFHGFHPIDDAEGAFEPVSEADYSTHLDYIKAKQDSGALWVEGPTPVLRYRFARTACAAPTVTSGHTLHFADPSADCKKYATTLSFLVSTSDASDPATLKVQQGSKLLPAKKLSAGHFVVDADPTAGDAVLVQ